MFIDGAYLDKLLEAEFGGEAIDFGKLATELTSGCELLRSYYYHCPPYQGDPPTDDEKQRVARANRYYTALSRLPRFQVRLGKLAYRGKTQDGRSLFVQKRVDIMLGVDMVQLAATRQINRALLLAGDSDFVPAVEVAKQHGVLVVLWCGSTAHRELWETCDDRFDIDAELVSKIKRDKPKRG